MGSGASAPAAPAAGGVSAEDVDISAQVARVYARSWGEYLRILDTQLRLSASANGVGQ